MRPVRGVDHVGLAVHDIEAATAFMQAAFGAEVLYDTLTRQQPPRAGAETEQRMHMAPGGRIEAIRMLRLGDGAGIELFAVAAADQAGPARSTDLGWQHVALYVDDMANALAQLQAAGGTVLAAPRPMPGPEAGDANMFCYTLAPFGAVIELISYPSPQPYAALTARRRWTPPPHA